MEVIILFDNNINLVTIDAHIEFQYINSFINMNNDEYYGYYRLYNNNHTDYTYLHINRNSISSFKVNKNFEIKDFFGCEHGLYATVDNKIIMNFDKINIDESDLIPINIRDVDIDNDRLILVKSKESGKQRLLYNTGLATGNNKKKFYVKCFGLDAHAFLSYDKENLEMVYDSTHNNIFRVKDNVGVRFFICKN